MQLGEYLALYCCFLEAGDNNMRAGRVDGGLERGTPPVQRLTCSGG